MKNTLAVWSCLLLGFCATAYALDPPYLDEFPDLQRIAADTESGDRFDDLARQAGTVRQLREAINILAGQRRWDNQLTPDEKRLITHYWDADNEIQRQAEIIAPKTVPRRGESPWTKWYLAATRYELDDDLRAGVMARYFSPETLRRLGYADAEHAAMAARGAASLSEGFGLKPKGRWAKQTPDEKLETLVVIFVLLLFTLPFLYRESRRFGLDRADPRKLRAGFRRFDLHWFSGIISDYKQTTEITTTTTTTHHRDGGISWKQSFTKTTYESFVLGNGDESHNISLTNSNITLANGHLVTAVWAIRKRKDEGPYILFLDRTSGESKPVKTVLWRIFKVRYWIMIPLLLLSSWLAVTTELYEFGSSGGAGLSASGQAYAAPFVLSIVLLVLFFWIASRRTRRFVKRDSKRLLAAVEGDESA